MQQARALLWLWILVGSIWLGVTGWNVANYWSAESVSSREYLIFNEHPVSWGERHPECRNRFGFWPDGTRMDADAEAAGAFLRKERGVERTPQEVDRDNWADQVHAKIASCEEAQWMPIVKANAIRQERIRVITFALFPPILFLIGVGLVRRTTRTINAVVAKLIATMGALCIAVVIAGFIKDVNDKFIDIVLGRSAIISLNDPSLGVICALLIPISIVLWWRRPVPPSRRMVACCLGIAAALVPVVAQIISWSFTNNSHDAVWAVAAMAVFATAVLSVCVTTRLLKTDLYDRGATTTVPHHIRRGLIRVYVALLIPWVAWFGYTAYKANTSINFDFPQLREFGSLSAIIDEAKTGATIEYARRKLGLMAMTWGDAKTQDEINHNIDEAVEQDHARLTTAIYALLGGVAPPLLYPIFLWLLAGFRRSAPITLDAPASEKVGEGFPQPHADLTPSPIREQNPPSRGVRVSPKVAAAIKKQPTVMDALTRLSYGNSPKKTANLQEAVDLSYKTLLGALVDVAEVRKIATQLYNGPMPYSTHDLAVATTLNLFRNADGARQAQLGQMQMFSRMAVLELLKERKVNPLLVKAFEDTLYKMFKPSA
jgi:hypothetical protein